MGNACYYSVEKLLSSSLLSKNLKVTIYKTVILPVVLYGCETWTLTLREEHGLRVFENKVLRKIFGAKRDEVTGEWGKLHSAELHALYSSPDIIRNIKSRRLRWAGHVERMAESRNAYRVLVGRPEGKRPFGEAETDVRFELTTSVPQESRSHRKRTRGEFQRDEKMRAHLKLSASQWESQSKQASLVYRSSTRVCVRNCISIRKPEFECRGPQLERPEFECSGPQLEGPEFEYSELSLKVCGSRYCELDQEVVFISLTVNMAKKKYMTEADIDEAIFDSSCSEAEDVIQEPKGQDISRERNELEEEEVIREDRKKRDKFAPIRDIWNMVVRKFPMFYNPNGSVTVDKELIPFHGRCPFRLYIPTKPGKCEIEVNLLCDSNTNYCLAADPYAG
ncbi:hypothetical protein ANN_23725 [Periplaneta americana]|uniref:PiggyBac transposable element-derived protein domain-containing protein n=1 Tax=Periplaneta americana TaxID=6978 RepID=A0ABQ8SLV3_PERAM|nr:hypothetical protein ANN_23725 [Periplaneta americana]